MKPTILMLFLLPAVAGNSWAHGGGLNKDGCHNDRKHGGYHCHRGSSTPAPTKKRYQPSNPLTPRRPASPATPHSGRAFANCS